MRLTHKYKNHKLKRIAIVSNIHSVHVNLRRNHFTIVSIRSTIFSYTYSIILYTRNRVRYKLPNNDPFQRVGGAVFGGSRIP